MFHLNRSLLGASLVLAAVAGPVSTQAANPPATASNAAPAPSQATLAALGKLIFADPSLSASGKLACASCHSPQHAGLAPNQLPVQLGGSAANLQGFRNVPTTTYALFTPQATVDSAGKLHGGQLLDGRALDLVAQAALPFVSANEMANSSNSDVSARLQRAAYFNQFKAAFGTAILTSADAVVAAMTQAIAAYERTDPSFALFTSKYDAVLNGKATLTVQEANGLALFNNPAKGNCAACHTSNPANGTAPLFTNHSYHALGVPRNWAIAYNNDAIPAPSFVPQNGLGLGLPTHHYYDLGACGPFRTNLIGANAPSYCGQFKVPTLRNTALKGAYEHNGVFSSLAQVLNFYTNREIHPASIYLTADGKSPDIPYNDLPKIYQGNIETPPPLHPLPGNQPRLSPSEQQDIITFLCTLTDGFNPANPAAYPNPPQCKAAVRP
jgi:cytochrome c peroxidase